jgi:hypothetical protein
MKCRIFDKTSTLDQNKSLLFRIKVNAFRFFFSVPIIDLKGADGLIGTVREDQRVISVVPELALLADTGSLHAYNLIGFMIYLYCKYFTISRLFIDIYTCEF